MALRVRIGEAEQKQPTLLWDSLWDTSKGVADWAIAGPGEFQNRGGLSATKALHTAIVLALFTDKRVPDNHPHKKFIGDADPRGWWGDDIDVRGDMGEEALGSLLWIYERAPLNEEVRRFVEVAAQEALMPLIKQGAAVRIDVQAIAEFPFNRLDLAIQVYGRDGQRVFDMRFQDLWRQVAQL